MMNLDVKIKYKEQYLPTKRHRNYRIREVEETVPLALREVSKDDLSLAMTVTDYHSYLDADGERQFGLVDTPIHVYNGQLFTRKKDMYGALDRGPFSFDQLLLDLERRVSRHAFDSRDNALRELQAVTDEYLLVDGEVYNQTTEPRYVVVTFGLGHNHGGTGMFIEFSYNPNIRKDNYFNALQRDEAIAHADAVAARRGDTKNVGTFGDINIAVHLPELIRCDPQREHGDGDPYLNSMERLIEASDSSLEAGILVMSNTFTNRSFGQKTSFSAQVHAAEEKAGKQEPFTDQPNKNAEPER